MKLLAVVGSPRKGGNTDILVDRMIEGAKTRGAEVEKVYLNDLSIRPCQGCDGCMKKNAKGCILKDDMIPLHESLKACDALIIGTPVYWFSLSAQTKLFMDRWYCLVVPGTKGPEYYIKGKRFAVAMAYGDTNLTTSGGANALGTFRDAAAFSGLDFVGIVHGTAGAKGDIASNRALLDEAYELGKKLCSE